MILAAVAAIAIAILIAGFFIGLGYGRDEGLDAGRVERNRLRQRIASLEDDLAVERYYRQGHA